MAALLAVVPLLVAAAILATLRITIFPDPVAEKTSTPAVSVVALAGAPAAEML
jgi:hypothetical protein